jgi:hypothetical protein
MKATLIAKSHVDQGLLAVVSAATATTVHLLALQFVLDVFAVRGVSNEGKNWTNAINEQNALCRFRII